MEKIKDWYFGAIEQYNQQDYLLAGSELNIDNLKDQKENYWTNQIAYNQFYINNSMCTIIAGAGILSNYFNYTYSKEELLRLVELAKKENPPFKDGVGWYIHKGVDLNRRYWNQKFPHKQVITYRIETWSDLFYKLLEKWYHIQGGFRWSRNFTADKKDNCKIDRVESIDNPTYWHSIYFAMKDGKIYTIDSYKGFGCNVYEVVNFEKLLQNWVYFTNSYIYIPKNNIMTQLQKDIELVEKALKCWITKNSKNLEDIKKWKYTQDVKTIIMIMRAVIIYINS